MRVKKCDESLVCAREQARQAAVISRMNKFGTWPFHVHEQARREAFARA